MVRTINQEKAEPPRAGTCQPVRLCVWVSPSHTVNHGPPSSPENMHGSLTWQLRAGANRRSNADRHSKNTPSTFSISSWEWVWSCKTLPAALNSLKADTGVTAMNLSRIRKLLMSVVWISHFIFRSWVLSVQPSASSNIYPEQERRPTGLWMLSSSFPSPWLHFLCTRPSFSVETS